MSSTPAFARFKPLKFKLKSLLWGAAGITLITGCVVTAPLWKQISPEADTLSRSGAVNSQGEVYQSFFVNQTDSLIVRKISADGAEQWRHRFDGLQDSGCQSGLCQSSIIDSEGGVIVKTGPRQLTRYTSSGEVVWQLDVIPAGAAIESLSRMKNGVFHVAYSAVDGDGLVALSEQGSERWEYRFGATENAFDYPAPKLASLESGRLVVAAYGVQEDAVLVFDAQGHLLQKHPLISLPWENDLVDDNATAYVVEREQISQLAADGTIAWQKNLGSSLRCAGASEVDTGVATPGVMCARIQSSTDTSSRVALAWLDATGDTVRTHEFTETRVDGGKLSLKGVRYNGDNKWALFDSIENRLVKPLPEVRGSFARVKILSSTGTTIKTITYKEDRWQIPVWGAPSVVVASSDGIIDHIVTPTRLYDFGMTAENANSFVSSYTLP